MSVSKFFEFKPCNFSFSFSLETSRKLEQYNQLNYRIQKGPKISHLVFANDCLIFGWATIKESEEILRLLKVYGELSG